MNRGRALSKPHAQGISSGLERFTLQACLYSTQLGGCPLLKAAPHRVLVKAILGKCHPVWVDDNSWGRGYTNKKPKRTN